MYVLTFMLPVKLIKLPLFLSEAGFEIDIHFPSKHVDIPLDSYFCMFLGLMCEAVSPS